MYRKILIASAALAIGVSSAQAAAPAYSNHTLGSRCETLGTFPPSSPGAYVRLRWHANAPFAIRSLRLDAALIPAGSVLPSYKNLVTNGIRNRSGSSEIAGRDPKTKGAWSQDFQAELRIPNPREKWDALVQIRWYSLAETRGDESPAVHTFHTRISINTKCQVLDPHKSPGAAVGVG